MKTTIQKLWISITMLCLSLQVSASDFEINGVLYTITSFTKLTVEASSISSNVTGDVTIPSTVTFKGKELAVTAIGSSFTYINNRITSITISDGVKEIGDWAFKNCSNLLTSSSCHPKFFIKEFGDFLMPCHQHGLGVNLLVQR